MNSRAKLIALDAKTGEPITSFGTNGIVDLTQGLRRPVNPKHYTNTSPPVVYRNLVILGNGVGDRLSYRGDPPGDVRAFDARTGKQVWRFNTVPAPGEPGHETWREGSWKDAGHTNVWAPMSLDDARGLLYLPVSTPGNDFYGAAVPARMSTANRSCVSTRRRAPALALPGRHQGCGTTTWPRRQICPSRWRDAASTRSFSSPSRDLRSRSTA